MEVNHEMDSEHGPMDMSSKDGTEDAYVYGFASDISYVTEKYNIDHERLKNTTLISLGICILFYSISGVFGKIKSSPDNGLKKFWMGMVYGDVFLCIGSCIGIRLLFYNPLEDIRYMCVDTYKDRVSIQTGFIWLTVGLVFIMSSLRTVTCTTWLHNINDVYKLNDLCKGIGLYTLSLMYILPLGVLLQQLMLKAEVWQDHSNISVCFPAADGYIQNASTLTVLAVSFYLLGITCSALLVAHTEDNLDIKDKRCVYPLLLTSHFLPTLGVSIWASHIMDVSHFPHVLPVTMGLVACLNSVCNFCSYKLIVSCSDGGSSDKDVIATFQLDGGMPKQNIEVLLTKDH